MLTQTLYVNGPLKGWHLWENPGSATEISQI